METEARGQVVTQQPMHVPDVYELPLAPPSSIPYSYPNVKGVVQTQIIVRPNMAAEFPHQTDAEPTLPPTGQCGVLLRLCRGM